MRIAAFFFPFCFAFFAMVFYSVSCTAQQNCMDATPICQNFYSQPNANTGQGAIADLTSSNQGCLTNGEVNASWYILNASTPGSIVFSITPNVATDDYDFAVWDITDTSCAALANGLTPLRCNFASLANSSLGGLTGLNTIASQTTLGASGPSFCSAIIASAGQTFVILVNNNSASTNGYTLSFSGSTAQIIDNVSPSIKNVIVPPTCGGPTQIKVLLKENVKCSSIAINGSDFSINGGYSINNAVGNSCSTGGVFSSSIYLTFNTALAPGNYIATINNGTDGNTLIDNCNNNIAAGTTFSFTVLPPVKVQVQPQFGCSGSSSGTITASGSGGYPAYKYKLNAGIFNVGNSFASLSAGTYTISIKDSLGCIDDTVITLSPAAPIVLNTISNTNLTCYNSSNGSITINANGGNAPLLYSVNSASYSTNNIIAGLGPGTYVVHTKDANGCIKDTIVLITSPGSIVGIQVGINNVSCLGLNNASIIYTANGGTLPLQYAINAGLYSSFANFVSLSIGTYTLHIKDANNCLMDTIITITQPISVLNATIGSAVQPSCSGSTGSISVVGMGGTLPYTFSINGTTYLGNNLFSSLSSGTYTVYVKDAGGCIASISAVLTSPGNLSFSSAILTQPTCINAGAILVTGSGGAAPLTFAIGASSYSVSNNFIALAAGSYTLHVKDNNGCIHDTIITLLAPPIPQIAISSFANATCSLPNSASLSVLGNGGTGATTFSLNGGAFSAITNFTNLSSGIYSVVVKDVNGCTSIATATIISNNTMAFGSASVINVGCGGSPLGAIAVVGIGGGSPYQYKINTNAFQTSGSFTSLAGGIYTITVQDANGCSKTTILVVQSSASFAIASFSFANATCSNPGNGTISSIVSGGVAPVVFNINGSNSASSNYNSLLPGIYTFTATDANGCSVSSIATITGPPPLWFINTTLIVPPCYGGVGSIITNGIGGLPPYTFALNNGAYNSIANYAPLPAGSYTIHLKDANGCIHDTIIDLIQPNPVLANNLNVVNASCSGAATGSISVTGGGTAGPYTYSINNGVWNTVNVFSNLAVGTYTIGVKDANGCTATIVASINNNGNFYFNTNSFILPLCVGTSNGSISFSAIGGSAPYTYKINSGTYQTSNNFINLAAGAYTLYVKDNVGCIVSQVVNLPNPNPIVFNNIIKNSPLCYNGNNGSITINGAGGNGILLYKLDGGVYTVTNNFTNISAGIHTLSIKDGNGCIVDSIINIINPLPIQFANSIIINPGCFGPGNGSITIIGNGGASPYTYKLNAGTFGANNLFNPLLAGTYTVSIMDANGCTNTTTIVLVNSVGVTITQVLPTLPLCLNSSNGIISVIATSLNLPVVYSLNGGSNAVSGNFTNLSIGTFTIHVTDVIGCFKDTIITLVTQSNLKIDSAITTSVLCYGDSSGFATLYTSGGSGAMSYSYNSFAYNSSNIITGLSNFSYTLHAKDALGCIVDTIVIIGAPDPIYFASSTLTAPFCNGSQDGIIGISAGGGTSPYQYSINTNPFSTSANYTNLIQGIYTFHILDAHGCLHDTFMFLQGPEIVYFSSFIVSDITCFGASDGSITAIASGGLAPYQYALNNNAFSTINVFNSLPSGLYTLIAVDNQGCFKDTIINIIAPTSTVSLQILNVINNKCRGDSSGSISVGGIGGSSPYLFSFNNPSSFTNSTVYNNLYASVYTIYIKDANGCSSDSTVMVAEPDSSVQIYLKGTSLNSCVGVYDATLSVAAKNGFPKYNYILNGVNYANDSIFYNLFAGDYVVEVKDSIGCKSTGKYKVDSTTRKPNIIINSIGNNICNYDSIGNASWQYVNAYNPVLCSINGAVFNNATSATLLPSGNYILQIIDDKGCKADTSFSITYFDSIAIQVTTEAALCSGTGDDGKVNASTKYGSAPFTYTWSIPTVNNTAAIDKLVYGAYSVIVSDSKGCVDSINFVIDYYPCCNMWIPNAFSPNLDNVNDNVIVKPSGPVDFISLEIYNRFGNKVFTTKDINTKWDGSFLGKPCELSTYFYILRYNCPLAKKVIIKKGDITLIR
jgi:large repetitive protein